MNRRWMGTCVGAVVALSIAMPQSSRLSAAPATPQDADPLSTCLETNRKLSVLFLVDTSGSLATTDPSNQRVTGLKLAVSSLRNLRQAKEAAADGGPGSFPVYVDFLSFGTGSKHSFDSSWSELGSDPTSEADLFKQIDTFKTQSNLPPPPKSVLKKPTNPFYPALQRGI